VRRWLLRDAAKREKLKILSLAIMRFLALVQAKTVEIVTVSAVNFMSRRIDCGDRLATVTRQGSAVTLCASAIHRLQNLSQPREWIRKGKRQMPHQLPHKLDEQSFVAVPAKRGEARGAFGRDGTESTRIARAEA
jgi:hypothetical protein